jgi:hypothetical protein
MKHLFWVLGLLALIPTFWFFSKFYQAPEGEGTHYLAYSGACFVASLIFWGIFFFIKFRESAEEEISITKL